MERYYSPTALVIFGYPIINVVCNIINLNITPILFGLLISILFIFSLKNFSIKRKYFLNIALFYSLVFARIFFDINTYGINVYGEGLSIIIVIFTICFSFLIGYFDRSSTKFFLQSCKKLVIVLSFLILIFLLFFHEISFDKRDVIFEGLGIITLPFICLISLIVLLNSSIKFIYILLITSFLIFLILLSGSRSVMILTLIYLFYKVKINLILKLPLTFFSLYYIFLNVDLYAINRLISLYEQFSETSRLTLYNIALDLIKENFLTGFSFRIQSPLGFSYPHNLLLEILMGTGILGLFLFLSLIYKISFIRLRSVFLFELFLFCFLIAQFSFSFLTNFYLLTILGFVINKLINFEKNNSIPSTVKL